jgi:hypothetical protein
MSRSESLRLYRDILRSCRAFVWRDQNGNLWSKVLKENARKEFEQARYEQDPLVIARLLFVGRDCLNKTNENAAKAKLSIQSNVESTRNK